MRGRLAGVRRLVNLTASAVLIVAGFTMEPESGEAVVSAATATFKILV